MRSSFSTCRGGRGAHRGRGRLYVHCWFEENKLAEEINQEQGQPEKKPDEKDGDDQGGDKPDEKGGDDKGDDEKGGDDQGGGDDRKEECGANPHQNDGSSQHLEGRPPH
ncbi:MAG: hypothetical protein WKG07_17585 [Hymenobacter sp.]